MNKYIDKIDFVVTWVDGDDPNWRAKHDQTLHIDSDKEHADSASRYRDYSTFKYWFRAVEKYAPWVNKIYLVTDNQKPEWLNTHSSKLVLVDHTDFIPQKYLPTFNSNVIEAYIHKIPNLSEHFVVFNDDVFINNLVKPDDFFKNGLPRDNIIFHPIFPEAWFDHIRINNIIKINQKYNNKRSAQIKYFGKIFNFRYGKYIVNNVLNSLYNRVPGFIDFHCSLPYLKSQYTAVVNEYEKDYEELSTHRVREDSDISQWLIRYTRLMDFEFYPQYANFGKSIYINNENDITKTILKGNQKVININDVDNEDDIEYYQQKLIDLFEEKFQEKSDFEI